MFKKELKFVIIMEKVSSIKLKTLSHDKILGDFRLDF